MGGAMSSITINGDTSGSIILQAPAVSGSTTLTLPTTTGTLVTSNAMPTGSVLQVVQGTLTGNFQSTSSSTFIDTGLTASITPKFSTSKILVIVEQSGCSKQSGNTGFNLRLLRGSSTIQTITDAGFYTGTTADTRFNIVSGCYLDSPATISSTTYKTQFANYANGVGSVYVNDYGNTFTTSTITLLEIAA